MEEQGNTQAPIRDNAPVAQVYKQEVRKLAFNLPPAPDLSGRTLPTDEEVLGSTKGTPAPTEEVNPTLNNEEGEVAPEEVEPAIESIEPEPNVEAEVATKEVAGEKIAEFNLENEEDNDFLKTLYKDDDKDVEADSDKAPVKAKASKETEAEYEEKYKPFKEKAAEYEAVLSDPMAKAFIEYLKSGKRDPNEFAKEAGFLNIETMTDKQVLEYECTQAKLSAEEIEAEIESFETMTPLQKKRHIDSTKSEMIQKRDEKLKAFTAGNEKAQKVQQEAVRIGMAQLNDIIPKMEQKKYEGLLITPEMANRIKQHVISHPEPAFDDNGQFVGYDIKESISTAVTKLYKDQWKKSLVELGRSIGADKTLTARIRPNKKVATSAVIPTQQATFDDVYKDRMDAKWKERGKPNLKK